MQSACYDDYGRLGHTEARSRTRSESGKCQASVRQGRKKRPMDVKLLFAALVMPLLVEAIARLEAIASRLEAIPILCSGLNYDRACHLINKTLDGIHGL